MNVLYAVPQEVEGEVAAHRVVGHRREHLGSVLDANTRVGSYRPVQVPVGVTAPVKMVNRSRQRGTRATRKTQTGRLTACQRHMA